MNAPELVVRLVAGAALILTNGFFVAIEFALTRARQFTEEEFVGDGGSGLRRAWEMTGAWLETEQDVTESRADLRHRLGSVLDEGDLSEELAAGDVEDPLDEWFGLESQQT
jgi:hypothetical protein